MGGRESLLNKGNFFTDPPTTTPLKTSIGQILNFGGHDGSECHRVPLPIRLNRKPFREQIGKCCTAFATTRHSRCDAVISFIWINSSRRSESQAAMTQCNQKMKVKAVMTIFGRSLTSGDLCVHFFNIFWNHFHSWNTLSTSLCSSFPFWTYCISQGMVRVCPFAIFLIGPWLEFDPSASEQFWLNEQFGPNAERFTDAWALTDFLHGNLLFIGHSSFNGGEFSEVFLLGRRLHVSASGYASLSRASAFKCGSRPARLVLHFWELSHCPHVADGECFFSVEPNMEGTWYQWRLLSAN